MFLLNVQMKFSVIYENQRDPEYLTSWYPKYRYMICLIISYLHLEILAHIYISLV